MLAMNINPFTIIVNHGNITWYITYGITSITNIVYQILIRAWHFFVDPKWVRSTSRSSRGPAKTLKARCKAARRDCERKDFQCSWEMLREAQWHSEMSLNCWFSIFQDIQVELDIEWYRIRDCEMSPWLFLIYNMCNTCSVLIYRGW